MEMKNLEKERTAIKKATLLELFFFATKLKGLEQVPYNSSYRFLAGKHVDVLLLLLLVTYMKISSISAKMTKFFSVDTSYIELQIQ